MKSCGLVQRLELWACARGKVHRCGRATPYYHYTNKANKKNKEKIKKTNSRMKRE